MYVGESSKSNRYNCHNYGSSMPVLGQAEPMLDFKSLHNNRIYTAVAPAPPMMPMDNRSPFGQNDLPPVNLPNSWYNKFDNTHKWLIAFLILFIILTCVLTGLLIACSEDIWPWNDRNYYQTPAPSLG